MPEPCDHEVLANVFSNLSVLYTNCRSSSPSISLAVDTLTNILAIYYLNFPLKNQTTIINHSVIHDEELNDGEYQHFVLGKAVLLSLANSCNQAKLIVRNIFGKFTILGDEFKLINASNLKENYEEIK